MTQDADVGILDAVSAFSISELDKDRQWLYPMSEALLHMFFFVRIHGHCGCNAYGLGHCRCVCHLRCSCCCCLHSLGGGCGGIAELLEVVAVATGGGR